MKNDPAKTTKPPLPFKKIEFLCFSWKRREKVIVLFSSFPSDILSRKENKIPPFRNASDHDL